MKNKVEDLEFGLSMFYKLKYEHGLLDYSQIPTMFNLLSYCSILLDRIERDEKVYFDTDQYFSLREAFDKYYRSDMIEYYDRSSIEMYLSSRLNYDLLLMIKLALSGLKGEVNDTDFKEWLTQTKYVIEGFITFDRYNFLSERDIIIGIKINEFQNEKVRTFLKDYFVSRMDFYFSRIHLSMLLSDDISYQPKESNSELSEKIKTHFAFFSGNCPRQHKQILKDTDFDKLIAWTISYFDNGFKVPEISEPISVVNTSKTYVQLAFKYLFKELHKASPYPASLFEFYKTAFSCYSEDRKHNFMAVKNNNEVKKLMQLEY